MANMSTTAPNPATTELEALIALVGRLSVAATEATRLAADAQEKLPALLTASIEATRLAIEVDSKLPMVLALHSAAATTWIRAVPKTPTMIEQEFPEGSGETWFLSHIGEANVQTDGVPNQFQQKKTSRREAILFYRDNYAASVNATCAATICPPETSTAAANIVLGVQKWVEVLAGTVV
ncbi:hypothetical protein B0H17DRAFT_1136379 [Mycena rosella]|uniref:Uncharacterized protein n=1 Tax=Mycena rosella TaxID=1033263 RepID=A0AAD7DE43_MYCRO|nr:hypothetical protein B0H17DRAFT_1136379 [Mycena rosella]